MLRAKTFVVVSFLDFYRPLFYISKLSVSFSFTSFLSKSNFLKITSWQSQRSNAGNCKIWRKCQVRRNSKKHPSVNWRTTLDIKNRSCHQLFLGFDVIFWMVYGWFHTIVDVFIQAYIIYKKIFSNIPWNEEENPNSKHAAVSLDTFE